MKRSVVAGTRSTKKIASVAGVTVLVVIDYADASRPDLVIRILAGADDQAKVADATTRLKESYERRGRAALDE